MAICRSSISSGMALPGVLVCDRIDFNDPETVKQLLAIFQHLFADRSRYVRLLVSKRYYLAATAELTRSPGWYVLLDSEGRSLYAGQADDLNSRLNTENGSRDQFGNPQRTSDPVRNFIKVFVQNGVIECLIAGLLTEEDLRGSLGFSEPLSKLDRDNMEKFLSLMRCGLRYSVS